MRKSGRLSRRAAGAALLLAVTATSWFAFHHLSVLPMNDMSEDEAGGVVQRRSLSWLYYWGHHTSTWWAALLAVVGTLTSAVIGAGLVRLAVHSTFPRSKIVGVLVAVSGGAAWLCGSAFLAVLAMVVWATASLEGTQTEVAGPDGKHVLVSLDTSGYHRVRVWRQDTSTRYVEVPGKVGVDPGSGPCTLMNLGTSSILRCGSTSQILKP